MKCLSKLIQHHQFISPLKSLVGVKGASPHKFIVPLTRYRPTVDSKIAPELWVKFDSESFDGINILAFLSKNGEEVASASCIFNVGTVSNDGTWVETYVGQVSGTLSGNRFTATLTSLDLPGVDLDGGTTMYVSCQISRLGKTYSKKVYVNHLGIYDNLFRLRQDVEFLEITKKDE